MPNEMLKPNEGSSLYIIIWWAGFMIHKQISKKRAKNGLEDTTIGFLDILVFCIGLGAWYFQKDYLTFLMFMAGYLADVRLFFEVKDIFKLKNGGDKQDQTEVKP